LREAKWHPLPATTTDATELEPKEPEALPIAEIHDPRLLVVHFNLDLGQLLT
jgi:hypothetical protein